jgi:hypothetical protein
MSGIGSRTAISMPPEAEDGLPESRQVARIGHQPA